MAMVVNNFDNFDTLRKIQFQAQGGVGSEYGVVDVSCAFLSLDGPSALLTSVLQIRLQTFTLA